MGNQEHPLIEKGYNWAVLTTGYQDLDQNNQPTRKCSHKYGRTNVSKELFEANVDNPEEITF